MKLAIMQPYLFPYIGYFQLMNAVDEFVVYDNIEFTKKGWINRNRVLVNGKDVFISFPLKKDSDYLDIRERYLAEIWASDRKKMLNRIHASYNKSPNFNAVFPLIEKAILFEENNLFLFILNSLNLVKDFLQINTSLITSSTILVDHSLKAEKKVIEICNARKADVYLNPIGGLDLYDKNEFKESGIDLHFLKADPIDYKQFDHDFVPWLSIIDVMMFNSQEQIKKYLNQYTLQ